VGLGLGCCGRRLNVGPVWYDRATEGSLRANAALYQSTLRLPFTVSQVWDVLLEPCVRPWSESRFVATMTCQVCRASVVSWFSFFLLYVCARHGSYCMHVWSGFSSFSRDRRVHNAGIGLQKPRVVERSGCDGDPGPRVALS